MRRHARRPQPVEGVELTEVVLDLQVLGKMMELVFVPQTAHLHGLLVQRGKADRIDLAGQGGVHGAVEHLEDTAPPCSADLADLDIGRFDRVHGHKGCPVGWLARSHTRYRRHGLRRDGNPCHALAPFPEPRVAQQNHVGVIVDTRHREQSSDQLGADTGWITQRQRHNRAHLDFRHRYSTVIFLRRIRSP